MKVWRWRVGVSLVACFAAVCLAVTRVGAQGGGATTQPGTAAKAWTPPKFEARQKDRDEMVQNIKELYNLDDKAVLDAMRVVPRHEFVPDTEDDQSRAYDDSPEPIPYGQVISQPWVVAEMTRELQLKPTSKVLEIGTGSGYQTAVLTHFTTHVFSVEIIKPMGEAAAARFKRLGYDGAVKTKIADGFDGWAEEGPFDAIIVTCAAGQIPPPLLKQLAPGGTMVIPVGPPFAMQSLMLVHKDADGSVRSRSLGNVKFVPLKSVDISTQPATAPK